MIGLLLAALALADGPDRPGDVVKPRTWDIEHLHLDVRVDIEARQVSGVVTHRIKPLASSEAVFRLNQVALDIQEVRVDGVVVDGWRARPGWLEIPVSKGKTHEVAVRYSAAPQTGMHFRRRATGERYDEAWTQGENTDHRHWFPGWDDPSDRFTVSVDVTAPAGLTAFANGTLTAQAPADPGWVKWSYRLDHQIVNYLVAVMVGEYRTWSVPGPGVPVETITGVPISEPAARAGTDAARAMLPWMEALIGAPYPYPVYRQVVVQGFLYGGMENTTLTALSDELVASRPWEKADRMEHVVAHELAHQWFGDLLTCYGWRELWLNEGFATYVTHRWWEHSRGPLHAAVGARRDMDAATWQSRPLAPRAWSKAGDARPEGVYDRGSSFLRFLEHHLGREVFDAGVRHYVATHRDLLVESEDLRRSLEDVSGADLGWAFHQWVYQGGAPTIQIETSWKPARGDEPASLDVVARREGDRAWIVPFDVEIGTPAGAVRRTMWLTGAESTLRVDLPDEPAWVVADPDRAVIARFKQSQPASAWVAAARRSPSPAARLEAIERLREGRETPEAVEALRSMAVDVALPEPVRTLAVQSLGRLAGPGAVRELLVVANDATPDARKAAWGALAGVATRPDVTRAVRLARSDADPSVRAAALQASTSHDRDNALQHARRVLGRSWRGEDDPERAAALDVLGTWGSASDLSLLLAATDEREQRSTRADALRAAAALVDRLDEAKERGRFTVVAAPLLQDEDQVVRNLTIGALRQGGDEQAARALTTFAASTHLEHHAERAKEAALAIRARVAGKPVPPPPADLERLSERLDALDRRLRDLERWR